MEMKELFERTFLLEDVDVKYIIGDEDQVFVIAKYCSDFFHLFVFNVFHKQIMDLKCGHFDELMYIVSLLTYSSDKVYYERIAE